MPRVTVEEFTVDQIEAVCLRLSDYAASLRGAKAFMTEKNIDKVVVRGSGGKARGFREINSFVRAVQDAIDEARIKRGDFGPVHDRQNEARQKFGGNEAPAKKRK